MPPEESIQVEVHLLPPLSNTAGRERIRLELGEDATLREVMDCLLEQFPSQEFYLHLYDTEGRLIPAWNAFINGGPAVRLITREGQATPVRNGDELTFLLALAGG